MSPDSLTETLQKGFRLTLGATASLLEAIQDPEGANQKFSAIGTDFERLSEELETKGATTEVEARQFVDAMLTQMPNPFQGTTSVPQTVTTTAVPVVESSLQEELAELTVQIAEIRREIELLKAEDQPNP